VSLGPVSFLGSWFSFYQTTKTGEQIDELCVFLFLLLFFPLLTCLQTVGGPDRPVLEKIPKRGAGATSEDGIATASSLAASTAAVQSSIYNKLSSAMNERG
jgi:syntaxin-binding protein 5